MTLLPLLLACTAGVIEVDPKDDTGVVTEDTGEEPLPHPATGDYSGEVGYWLPETPWGDSWEICDFDFEVTVDEDGNVEGSGTCIYNGQQDDYDLYVGVEGEISEEGEVDAQIEFQMWEIDGRDWVLSDMEADLEGEWDDGELELEFWGEADLGREGVYDLEGWVDLELD